MPTRLNATSALAYWYEALKHEIGVRIPVNPDDLNRIRILMYKVRQDANDPELEVLMITIPQGGTEMWIMKRTVEVL